MPFAQKQNNCIKTIYLIDNCLLSRTVQKREIALIGGFNVVEVFKSADECILRMHEKPADVVLINLDFIYTNSIDVITKIKQKFPDSKVIIHTSRKSEQKMLASFVSGANSYILKGIKETNYQKTLEKVLQEGYYMDSATFKQIFLNLSKKEIIANSTTEPINKEQKPLTKRELEVLSLVGQGKSNPQIARELGTTTNTVKTQIKSILFKLKATDRAQAAVYAVKANLI